jgi:peptidoglycan hydrolase-like protein with peptidoglycan-binding domain
MQDIMQVSQSVSINIIHMNNTTTYRETNRGVALHQLFLGVAIVSALSSHQAYAMITSQLDFGDSGSQVTELQTYLSTSPTIYPSGLVTGYFGSLTQGGVQKFQVSQGVVSAGTPETTGYGRAGPRTMALINSMSGAGIGGGTGFQSSWDQSPILANLAVQTTNTTATFTWTSNEQTQGQVYWSTGSIQADEATGPRQQPYVSGTLALDAGGLRTDHSVTVSNLQGNTTYYYLIRGVDSDGNMSMSRENSFRTN